MWEYNLFHQYQAWQQGNEHHWQDWPIFVEQFARRNNIEYHIVLCQLQKFSWFNQLT